MPGTRHVAVPKVVVLSQRLTLGNFQQTLHCPPPVQHLPQDSNLCDLMPAPCWPLELLIPTAAWQRQLSI
jgi:hypothetical protein